MITAAMTAPIGHPQPLLFDSLPETPSRRPARRGRANATAVAESIVADEIVEPVPAFSSPPPRPVSMESEPFQPAALTNPELRALVQALPDARLSYLIVEAAREIKRRLLPDDAEEADVPSEPNPALLRAARLAAGELTGDD